MGNKGSAGIEMGNDDIDDFMNTWESRPRDGYTRNRQSGTAKANCASSKNRNAGKIHSYDRFPDERPTLSLYHSAEHSPITMRIDSDFEILEIPADWGILVNGISQGYRNEPSASLFANCSRAPNSEIEQPPERPQTPPEKVGPRKRGDSCCSQQSRFRHNSVTFSDTSSLEDSTAPEKRRPLFEKLDSLVWLNPKKEHVKTVEGIVESYIDVILKDMRVRDPRWNFELIKCGSHYEHLRVGMPFEFDFMLHLTTLEAVDVRPGWSKPLDNFEVTFSSSLSQSAEYEVDFEHFKRDLIPTFREGVRKHDNYRGLKVLEVLDHYNSPNMCLFLKYKDIGVMIDLVPCVKFPPQCRKLLPKYNEDTLSFASKIIPEAHNDIEKASDIITNNLYLVSTAIESHWRISSSVPELLIMQNLPTELKRSLRILKYLCKTHLIHSEPYEVKHLDRALMLKLYGYKPFLPSFVLKLLFLFHVVDLYQGNVRPGMYHNDTTGVLQKIIENLREFKVYINFPIDKCFVEINSVLFGQAHKHKFSFVQNLVYKTISKNIGWYDKMINNMEIILDEEMGIDDDILPLITRFRTLNFPPLKGVGCYINPPQDM